MAKTLKERLHDIPAGEIALRLAHVIDHLTQDEPDVVPVPVVPLAPPAPKAGKRKAGK
jgi:hypothetical protein